MATLREAIDAVRGRFPEHVAAFGLSHHEKGGGHTGKLGEDGEPDERGRKSWWFEFRYYEDDGTEIRFGDGYVHANGHVEGLYSVEWFPEEYALLSATYGIYLDHPGAVPGAAWVGRWA